MLLANWLERQILSDICILLATNDSVYRIYADQKLFIIGGEVDVTVPKDFGLFRKRFIL